VTDVEVDLVSPERQPLKALLSSRLLPGEFDRKVFFARDVSVLKRLEELEVIGAMFQEIATQTRTPLALVSGALRRLQRKLPPEIADVLAKTLKQLRKVEITHERLLLLDGQEPPSRRDRVELDIRSLIDSAVHELTDDEQRVIELSFSNKLPLVQGDHYQLWFVVHSLFSYLLRYLPNDERINVHVEEADGAVDIRIMGFVPADASGAPDGIARTRAEVALGITILRRFIEQHGGTYRQKTTADSATEFRIRLPASSARKEVDDGVATRSPRTA
jgi:K+-sensing histidine kinase KdpD